MRPSCYTSQKVLLQKNSSSGSQKSIIKNWIIVQCNSRDLIGLAAMVYEPLYHARGIVTIDYLLAVLAKRNQLDLAIFLYCF